MQFEAAVRCAGRALAFAVALVVAWSVAFAPAAHAEGGAPRTPAATQHDRRSVAIRHADWSAGPVTRWTGYVKPHGSRRVREVQRTLNRLGYHSGPVDGLFGPITDNAVHKFQARHRLRVDGIVGQRTLRALRTAEHRFASRDRTPLNQLTSPFLQKRHPAPVSHPAAGHPHHPPALPVTAILAVLGALGLAMMWRGYALTSADIRRMQRDQLPAAPGAAANTPTAHDQNRRVRQPVGAGPVQGRPRGHG